MAEAEAKPEFIGERFPASGVRPLVEDLPAGAEADGDEVSSLHLRLDRLMALDKLKSDFMNLTTHELRSPLAIVYGYLSMMESGMLGELSEGLHEACLLYTSRCV